MYLINYYNSYKVRANHKCLEIVFYPGTCGLSTLSLSSLSAPTMGGPPTGGPSAKVLRFHHEQCEYKHRVIFVKKCPHVGKTLIHKKIILQQRYYPFVIRILPFHAKLANEISSLFKIGTQSKDALTPPLFMNLIKWWMRQPHFGFPAFPPFSTAGKPKLPRRNWKGKRKDLVSPCLPEDHSTPHGQNGFDK